MKSRSKTLSVFTAIAVGGPIFAGCVSEQKLNEGMGATLTPFYHYPMVASGGYDLLFCSWAFMRREERWPKDYRELIEFVEQSGGYLALGKYERVEFGQLPNNGVQITFVPHGSTNELGIRVGPTEPIKFNQNGATNASQPVRSETNTTSSAAGSRR